MSDSAAHGRAAGNASVPFLRTFESQRFRLVVAVIVTLLGIALNLARLSVYDPADMGLAFDFAAYYHAAERMLAGSSPYTATQLDATGAGLCLDCYLYPPFFAQLLSPITLVPIAAAKVMWLILSYVAAFVSTWLATGIGGATRSLERAVWCLAAVLLFDGVASAAWNGNVGTFVALGVTLVALGGVAAGVGAALGLLLKVSPGTLLPAVFAADRESRTALLVTLVVVVGSLFLLAPQAWLEYPVVLRDVFASPSEAGANLAINQIVSNWGWGSDAVSLVRAAMVATGGLCVVVSIWLARQRGGMPAAALLGTVAMLIVPGTLWFHYLAVLLPFAAMAWLRAGLGTRSLLLTSAAVVSIAPYLGEPPVLVYLGSTLLLVAAGRVLWPRRAGGGSGVAPSRGKDRS